MLHFGIEIMTSDAIKGRKVLKKGKKKLSSWLAAHDFQQSISIDLYNWLK